MKFGRRRRRQSFRRIFLGALVGTALLAPAALAETPATGAATPKMKVAFTQPTASTISGRALVGVRCDGFVARECVGSLALETPTGSEKVAFSIAAGEKRIVVVPLNGTGLGSARAVAETMQLEGASVRTSRVLRIK